MSNPASISEVVAVAGAVGGLTPLLTALVQRPSLPKPVRVIIGLVMAIATALATVAIDPNMDFGNTSQVISVVVLVIIASQTAFLAVWKPSGVADSIEVGTSPGEDSPDPGDGEDDEPGPSFGQHEPTAPAV